MDIRQFAEFFDWLSNYKVLKEGLRHRESYCIRKFRTDAFLTGTCGPQFCSNFVLRNSDVLKSCECVPFFNLISEITITRNNLPVTMNFDMRIRQ